MSVFVPHTVLAQGRRYTAVALASDVGTQITLKLADASNAALSGAASYGFVPMGLIQDQEVWARQILLGKTAGGLSLSGDGGATWVNWTLAGAHDVGAVAIGEASTPQYPHAYAGLANGDLYSYTEAHDGAGTGTWAQVGTTGSGITALTLPYGSHGIAWAGCADGSLWRYSPALGLYCVAQLPGAIADLAHLQETDVVYGVCADAGVGLFMAMSNNVDADLFSLDHSQGYQSLASAGTRALAGAGASHVAWSPDSGASLGYLADPPTPGPYNAVAVSWEDHNEGYVLTTGGALYVTTDNGASWSTVTIPGGMTRLSLDRHYPSVLYAWGGGSFCVSYDRGASWDTVVSGGITAVAAGELATNITQIIGNAWTGDALFGVLLSGSYVGGAATSRILPSFSYAGGGDTSTLLPSFSYAGGGDTSTLLPTESYSGGAQSA